MFRLTYIYIYIQGGSKVITNFKNRTGFKIKKKGKLIIFLKTHKLGKPN